MRVTYWGVHEVEGMKFYLEPQTVLSEFCPLEKPEGRLACPHYGLNESNAHNWRRFLYIEDSTLGYDKLMKLIPSSLKYDPSLTFVSAQFLPSKQRLLHLLQLTNALPLFIYGISLNTNFGMIFDLVRTSMIRPVYMSGSSTIPIPTEFKEKSNVEFRK